LADRILLTKLISSNLTGRDRKNSRGGKETGEGGKRPCGVE